MRNDYSYGEEIIIDLHNCNPDKFNRRDIERYFIQLCELIDMERVDLHWWDDITHPDSEGYEEDNLIGISAIQFIKTSNITIHCLSVLKKTYINLFSCKDFDEKIVMRFTEESFQGTIVNWHLIRRQ